MKPKNKLMACEGVKEKMILFGFFLMGLCFVINYADYVKVFSNTQSIGDSKGLVILDIINLFGI